MEYPWTIRWIRTRARSDRGRGIPGGVKTFEFCQTQTCATRVRNERYPPSANTTSTPRSSTKSGCSLCSHSHLGPRARRSDRRITSTFSGYPAEATSA